MSVHEKLLKIQSSISVPKNQHNKFGNYDYRSCEDILSALKPLLVKMKCTVVVKDDLIMIGDRYYIKATATLIDCEDGNSISNESFAREEESKKGMDSSQITGTASSYARKYALNGLLLLDDVKDADTNENQQQTQDTAKSGRGANQQRPQNAAKNDKGSSKGADSAKAKGPIDARAVESLRKRFAENAINEAKVCGLYNVSAISKLSVAQYDHLLKYFEDVKSRCAA